MDPSLASFSEPVRAWFEDTFREPTAPQAVGWPAIQRGEHTLILAPTGSGKTLAAFLWSIDQIGRELLAGNTAPGVRLLYVSPLKALNNDIERNLRAPLEGIRATAGRLGIRWPRLHTAVRTGDTPAAARAGMVKNPPHILITTPESLYLILTSPRAREMLRGAGTVIVDEIHTLVGDKRGAHLALSLERLEHLAGAPIQRIGLSATVRPLEEAARFLGGQLHRSSAFADPETADAPRPVTVIDTGYRKPLDLQVITPVDDFRDLPADSIWPSVIPQVLHDVMLHRTTLIFCNNRRLAERTADRLNAQIAAERSEEIPPGSAEALAPGGVARDKGMFAIGAEGPIRAHHGSMSREARREMEEDLKAGRLPALVGTSSLELGIDIGAVDLVVQLQSPKGVAQGLQRVGRSGHLVGQTSRGRIYATFREDLLEAAAVARGMLEGDVEETHSPRAPLDVMAQQILAMVSVEPWDEAQLFALIRCAYPYRALTRGDFEAVLEMLSGKYATLGVPHPSLRARIAWDRAGGRLFPLPGSRLLALGNAGTITDRGAFDVVLADGTTRVGTLDEEFVFESRAGDAFILGSSVWRILEIADDRIVVSDAAGASPRMPFWRGDYPWRPYELGTRIAQLRRVVAARLRDAALARGEDRTDDTLVAWLQRDYALDERSARNLLDYVQRQLDSAGEIATDDVIIVESFSDAVGEARVVVHSPFGGRVNGAWALALGDALHERMGVAPEIQANDDGILFRLPAGIGAGEVLAVLRAMSGVEARARILRALPGSALFGAHFRMSASRALLLPRAMGRKRTPFWLQRLKAKDLLALVRRFDDFPLIRETYRECLEDILDLPHLESLLDGIQSGQIRVNGVEAAVPSPVAAGMLFNFVSTYMYEWDAPKAERQLLELAWQADLPGAALPGGSAATLLRPEAVADAIARARHIGAGRGARTPDELAVFLEEAGDLTEAEALARCSPPGAAETAVPHIAREWLAELARAGRIAALETSSEGGSETRYVITEMADAYRDALTHGAPQINILRRFLSQAGPIDASGILRRYPFDSSWLDEALLQLERDHEIVPYGAEHSGTYLHTRLFEQARRRTVAILRREIQPVSLADYAHFLTRWQHLSGPRFPPGAAGVGEAIEQLAGLPLPALVWEQDILPARVPAFRSSDLAELLGSGSVAWAASGNDPRRARISFFPRGEGRVFLHPADPSNLSDIARSVYLFLAEEGASLASDIEKALGLPGPAVRSALVELALANLATADSGTGLHAILAYTPSEAAARRPLSGLEADLAARRARPDTILRARDHRHGRPLRRDLRRLALEHAVASEAVGSPWSGRWGLLHRAGVLGPARSADDLASAHVQVLLHRHGVIARELIAREDGPFDWVTLSAHLARMEMRGEVRRGFFIAGLSGQQYALPDAVEQLRAAAAGSPADTPLVVLNATDPAQVYGVVHGGTPAAPAAETPDTEPGAEGVPRFARIPSTHLVLHHGTVLLLSEDGGERLWTPGDLSVESARNAVAALLARPAAPRRAVVRLWNGEPALGGLAQEILRPLGFSRAPGGLERWAPPG